MNLNLKKGLVILGVILVLAGAAAYFGGVFQTNHTENAAPAPAEGHVTIKGTIVCLPHRGDPNAPQTMECAFGLRDDEGHLFALHDTDPGYKNVSSAPMNTPVIVEGELRLEGATTYQNIGIIDVQTITAVDAAKHIDITGTYVCLPHKDQSGPQTQECALGIHSSNDLYYALDLALIPNALLQLKTGDKVEMSGVVIPIDQISSDRWKIYGIVGIVSAKTFKKL